MGSRPVATILSVLVVMACTAPVPQPAASRAGRWVPIPNVPLAPWSAALLPTGKVLLFQSGSGMVLFDPRTRGFGPRISARTNLFCAGLALLGDGRLVAAGGHEGTTTAGKFLGAATAEVFDPWSERWSQLPDMRGGPRWYPTAVTLPDGRVLVASGTDRGRINDAVEILDPMSGEWEIVGHLRIPMYSWPIVDRSGVTFFGPDRVVWRFEIAEGSYRALGRSELSPASGVGVLFDAPAARALAVGRGPDGTAAEVFEPATGWKRIASTRHPRVHANAALLPDGSVIVVGGHPPTGAEEDEATVKPGLPLPAETFDERTGEWQELERAYFGHGYHSVAVLLPDGSVLVGGPKRELEIYLPWYMAVARPAILDAAAEAVPGTSLRIRVKADPAVRRAVAIRISSVTHSLDTDRRAVPLEDVRPGDVVTARIPAGPHVIPGYYLLFVVDARGVPSEGRMLRIR